MYEKDFRQEAVNLLLSSGRSRKRVAAELGVTANSLRTWRSKALGKGRVAQDASSESKGCSEAPVADPAGGSAACSVNENLRRQRDLISELVNRFSCGSGKIFANCRAACVKSQRAFELPALVIGPWRQMLADCRVEGTSPR